MSAAIKTLEEELNKDLSDLRYLCSKLGKTKVAWKAYKEALETFDDSGEEETPEQLLACLEVDGYNHLEKTSGDIIFDALELLDIFWLDTSKFLA